jgi:membrane protein implicated in regulation of membrane protease activity
VDIARLVTLVLLGFWAAALAVLAYSWVRWTWWQRHVDRMRENTRRQSERESRLRLKR